MSYRAEIRVSSDELASRMAKMRIWLDGRNFYPQTFRYATEGKTIEIHADFGVETEAASFAEAFGGRMFEFTCA